MSQFITLNMKMADVVQMNYMLLPVINRFEINLGFADKSVADICKEKKINSDFFLEILNTFHNENYQSNKTFQYSDVIPLVHYLQKTHYYYLKFQIPTIEHLIDILLKSCTEKCDNLNLVKRFFIDYKDELTAHIGREEQFAFPYILNVYKLYSESNSIAFKEVSHNYSMRKYEKEHNNVDEKLFDLKNILIKYISLPYDNNLCNAVIFELFRLEKDIKDHSRIEDKIVTPIVIDMENKLLNKLK